MAAPGESPPLRSLEARLAAVRWHRGRGLICSRAVERVFQDACCTLRLMGAPWRRLVAGGMLAAALLGVSAGCTQARRAGRQQCEVTGVLPSPPAPRPRYAVTVRVLSGLRAVVGAVSVTFTAPPGHGTDRLVFRLWPNGPRYARAGAHLSVSGIREGSRALPVSFPDPTTLSVARPIAAGEQAVVSGHSSLSLRGTGAAGRSIRRRCSLPRRPGQHRQPTSTSG